MKRRVWLMALGLLVAGGAHPARAELSRGSLLALPLLADAEHPELVLAQRTIDRTWGPSDDSLYHEVSIPDWKSEPAAMALSAVVPGLGQVYVGERTGWFYTIAGAAAWFESWYNTRRGREIRDDAYAYAGVPTDSTARFSFDTWEKRTGQSSDALRALYAADRNLFYFTIARDEAYRWGWADFGYTDIQREQFIELREDSQAHMKRGRYFQAAAWIDHLVAALDGLRTARAHNLPLRQNLNLKVGGRLNRGNPVVTAALETRF